MDLVELNLDQEYKHPWELARQAVVHDIISTLDIGDQPSILDVGSGDAFLAEGFTHNFDATSYCVDIEYTQELIDNISNRYSNHRLSLHADLVNVKAETEKIDLITLLDVIEHVPNDVELLSEIIEQPYIDSDSYVLVTVPAYERLFSQHDVLLKHYRRYNLPLLKKSFSESNITFLRGGYFFSSLLVPRIIQVLKQKFRKNDLNEVSHLGNWNGGGLKTGVLKNVLLSDYRMAKLFNLLGVKIPGLSCYALGRVSTASR